MGRTRAIAPAAAVVVFAVVGLRGPTGSRGGRRSFAAASASRSVSLNESGRLHLTSKQGFTLNEQGSASGTITGTIYIHLHLTSTSKVTAEVSIYPSGGSLTGNGSAATA